jgi:midasin (ATPase involved in ribosome maturation)
MALFYAPVLSTNEVLDKLESLLLNIEELIPAIESMCPDVLGSLDELKRALLLLKNKIAAGGDNRGAFKWFDSTLIQAVQEGYWLLMDNANLCRLVCRLF